ncbi:MAG: APC family permease [Alicyclobacillus sp.]|nr:APC family permease [Alicyclobacillus sp.]
MASNETRIRDGQPAFGTRTLTMVHAVGQSLAIGPIFSAGLLTSLIAAVSGYSAPLAVLLGSIGAVGLAYVIGIFARRYAGAGAVYEYLTRGANPTFGVFSAGLYFLGSLFLGGGGIYIAEGFFAQSFVAGYLGGQVPLWIFSVGILLIVFLLNHFGVRIAIQGVLVLAGLSSLPFIVLSLLMIVKGGVDGNTWAVFTTAHSSWNGVFNGILFAVTLFIGFEAAASIAEESRMPKKSIPVAVVSTVVVSSLFYILVCYAAAIGFGQAAIAKGAWADAGNPMAVLGAQYIGKWFGMLMDLVVILDMVSVSIAIMVTCSRGFFVLGRDGLLPRWMAKTSRHGTPLAGNLVVVVWSLILILWACVQNWGKATQLPNTLQTFFITTSVGSYLIELIYLFLAVVALKILWREYRLQPKHLWKYGMVLLGLVTPILAFRGSIIPFPAFPNSLGVYIAVAGLLVVACWTTGVRGISREAAARAAAYDPAGEQEGTAVEGSVF